MSFLSNNQISSYLIFWHMMSRKNYTLIIIINELNTHTHIKKVLFLSKLVNIQLCISTHDKECIKLQKRQRPCSIILKCVVGHGHTKMNATTFVTSACGIIYLRIKFWIVHVAVVLGFMFLQQQYLVFYVCLGKQYWPW